jgi:surface antigen
MPKILAITEAMHGYAKNVLAKAGEIQSSHGEMERVAGGMTPYFSGTLPELLTRRLLDMKKKHAALYEKVAQYSEKVDYAADNYDWSDREIAGWANRLGVGAATLMGSAAVAGGTTVPATENNLKEADLNSLFYYSINPKNPNSREIKEGGKNSLPYREFHDTGRMNCTFYCYGRAMEKLNLKLTEVSGNGGDWLVEAERAGIRETSRDVSAIRSNCLAVFPPSEANEYGHVAFIEEVREEDGKKYVYVSEGNAGSRSKDGKIRRVTYEEFLSQYGTPSGYIFTD